MAGPLGFSEAGRAFHVNHLIPTLQREGHVLFDPWADQGNIFAILQLPPGAERFEAWRKANFEIGRKNQLAIDWCDAVVAVLDGSDVDSGTAAEIGYAFANDKLIVGYRSDFRLSADNEGGIVNLQVEYFIRASGGQIVRTITELPAAITTPVRNHNPT